MKLFCLNLLVQHALSGHSGRCLLIDLNLFPCTLCLDLRASLKWWYSFLEKGLSSEPYKIKTKSDKDLWPDQWLRSHPSDLFAIVCCAFSGRFRYNNGFLLYFIVSRYLGFNLLVHSSPAEFIREDLTYHTMIWELLVPSCVFSLVTFVPPTPHCVIGGRQLKALCEERPGPHFGLSPSSVFAAAPRSYCWLKIMMA